MSYVSYTQLDKVTGTQLAVYGQVEESQIACLLRQLETHSNGSDVSDSERSLVPDELSLIPRPMAVQVQHYRAGNN